MTQGGGSAASSDEEIDLLLDLIKEYLPIGNIAWMRVVDEYNRRVPAERAHNKNSILKRFNTLHQRLMPTGDPNMPDNVRKAKHLNYLIMDKSECVNMNGDEEASEEDDKEELLDDPVAALLEANKQAGEQKKEATATDATIAAIRPIPLSISTGTGITSSRTSRAQNKRAKSDTDKMIEAFVKMEEVHLRRQKAKDKEERMQMKAFMGLVGGALTAFVNSNRDGDGHGLAFGAVGASLFGESSDSDDDHSSTLSTVPPLLGSSLLEERR
jgi:hypothetical protein